MLTYQKIDKKSLTCKEFVQNLAKHPLIKATDDDTFKVTTTQKKRILTFCKKFQERIVIKKLVKFNIDPNPKDKRRKRIQKPDQTKQNQTR